MTALRKPLNPEPDPQVEAALAASMARLKRRCEEVELTRAASAIDRKLMDAGALQPGEVIDLGTGEIQVHGGSGGLHADATGFSSTHAATSPDGAKPSPTPATLSWLERVKGTNFQKSTCGQYTVSAARVNGQWRFSAYYGPSPSKVLGQAQESGEAARAIAEAHARSWK